MRWLCQSMNTTEKKGCGRWWMLPLHLRRVLLSFLSGLVSWNLLENLHHISDNGIAILQTVQPYYRFPRMRRVCGQKGRERWRRPYPQYTALLFRPSTLSTKMPTNGLMIPWKVYSGRGIHFIPMLALLKRTISRYASAIPIASRAIFFQEVLIRHIPIHSKPHNTKPAIMYKRETINYVKGEQIMTETFGHSKDLFTLSQVLTYNNLYIIKTRGYPRKYTAFLVIEQGKPHCI